MSAALIWGILLTVFTEILSIFKLITLSWLVGLWGLLSATLIFIYIQVINRGRAKNQQQHQNPSLEATTQPSELLLVQRDGNNPPVSNQHKANSVNIKAFCLLPSASCLLIGIAFILTTVGLIAIIAAPNTLDSMTYHLSRVVHWSQNHSVAHYPTHIGRQLYQNPWAEFTILHLQILSGSDRLANLVQWSSMVGSIVGISLIAKQLGADLRGQILAAVVAVTIPMGILQGSSTQNDYVVSFWVICLAYYVLLTVQVGAKHLGDNSSVKPKVYNPNASPSSGLKIDPNILAVSASMGLAILTKATAYIYTFPLFIWFFFSLLKRLRWQIWKPIGTVAVMVLLLNCGHYLRNLDVYGAPIASDPGEPKYTNDIFTASALISNILRNFGLHLGTPVGLINATFNKIIHLLHLLLNVDVNDPRTTYMDLGKFGIPGGWSTIGIKATENNTSNTIHFLLIIFSIILCLSWRPLRKKRYLLSYLTVVSSIFVLFCFLLKWQWWHSRLHLPIFLLFSALVGVVLSQITQHQLVEEGRRQEAEGRRKESLYGKLVNPFSSFGYFHRAALVNSLAAMLILASLPWLFSGRERPLIGDNNIFKTTRIEQYFNSQASKNKATVRNTYLQGIDFLQSSKCSKIGLLLGHGDLEYPLWVVLQESKESKFEIQHVKVENPSAVKSKIEPYSSFVPCAIFSSKLGKDAESNKEKIVDENGTYIKTWSKNKLKIFLKQ
ncbi:MAG: hypothetical protein F6K14_23525 [Symploca sp. SIO2C1]|nr:hypothetical protein [Symploca sp. SIO2C1]